MHTDASSGTHDTDMAERCTRLPASSSDSNQRRRKANSKTRGTTADTSAHLHGLAHLERHVVGRDDDPHGCAPPVADVQPRTWVWAGHCAPVPHVHRAHQACKTSYPSYNCTALPITRQHESTSQIAALDVIIIAPWHSIRMLSSHRCHSLYLMRKPRRATALAAKGLHGTCERAVVCVPATPVAGLAAAARGPLWSEVVQQPRFAAGRASLHYGAQPPLLRDGASCLAGSLVSRSMHEPVSGPGNIPQ